MYPTLDEKIMLEKRYGRRTPLPLHHESPTEHSLARSRSRRSFITYLILILVIFSTVLFGLPSMSRIYSPAMAPPQPPAAPSGTVRSFAQSAAVPQATDAVSGANRTLVPLEAHVMSKCPDARDALRDLILPTMEKVADKVDFQLSYIGAVDRDGNINCKHGPTECLGNMMGLCAQHLYPNDVKRWLGFSACLISSYEKIPDKDLAQSCALEHGIDFEMLNACMSEEGTGLDLLESSIQRTEKANVTISCTVRLDSEIWCIRDGGAWKDCKGGHKVEDLVTEIEKRYRASG